MKHHDLLLKGKRKKASVFSYFLGNYELYLMSLPGLLFLCVYKFLPLYGLTLAFKQFNIFGGQTLLDSIAKSPWVGFFHFERLFSKPEFLRVLGNTLIISSYKIFFLFPLPILLALLLNEVRNRFFKRTIQTLIYIPHFLSWVVVFGLFYSLLGSYGIVNNLLRVAGIEPVRFFMDTSLFRGILVFTEGWKDVGWSTIVYLAALTAIDPELYEAAVVDGANRFRQITAITIPGIIPVVSLMLILRVGKILEAGSEQVLAMYNPSVYDVGDIIETYVYRIGLGQMDFSLGTALGLFNSVVAFLLIFFSNAFSRRLLGKSIW
ncbi:MAG: ABC transporter permease subunit [Treponemataceae bacterium]